MCIKPTTSTAADDSQSPTQTDSSGSSDDESEQGVVISPGGTQPQDSHTTPHQNTPIGSGSTSVVDLDPGDIDPDFDLCADLDTDPEPDSVPSVRSVHTTQDHPQIEVPERSQTTEVTARPRRRLWNLNYSRPPFTSSTPDAGGNLGNDPASQEYLQCCRNRSFILRIFDLFILMLEFFIMVWSILRALVASAIRAFKTPPLKSVVGEVVLVTGAGSGIGRLLAVAFARRGATVLLWDVNRVTLFETLRLVESVSEGSGGHAAFLCDLANRDEVYSVARRVQSTVGAVTMVINNAGVAGARTILDCPDDVFETTMKINAMSHVWIIKAFLPSMIENSHGHVVSIASVLGFAALPGCADYSISKYAAIGIAETLHAEIRMMRVSGVKTTLVCPYKIDTGMFHGCHLRINWVIPTLKSNDATDRIMRAILTDQPSLNIPYIVNIAATIKTMIPVSVYDSVCKFLGVDSAMNDFVGRGTPDDVHHPFEPSQDGHQL